MKVLIYGFGNPGRRDDGLGIDFARQLEEWVVNTGLKNFSFDNNYQLNIEDAVALAANDLVIFADASTEDFEDFCVTRVDGVADVAFTSHSASPGYILKLSQELYKKDPVTLLVHIKGYRWEFREGLSAKAKMNLKKAVEYMKIHLLEPESIYKKFK